MKLNEALAKFKGLDVDGIAGFLRDQQVTGLQGRPFSCPISVFLSREVGKEVGVSRLVSTSEECTYTPENIREFTHHFDRGFYPDLIAENG